MKRILASLMFIFVCQFVFAQESFHDHRRHVEEEKKNDEPKGGFNKSNLFVGGSLSLGYTSGYGSFYDASNGSYSSIPSNVFNVGALPEVGYKITNLLDVGLQGNINYYATSSSQYTTYKNHDLDYGIGPFARISPIEQFFIQIMPELDWIKQTSISSDYTTKSTFHSSSFLVGAGYKYQSNSEKSYFYAVLMIDVAKGYTRYKTYDQGGGVIPIPILRLAYNYFPFR